MKHKKTVYSLKAVKEKCIHQVKDKFISRSAFFCFFFFFLFLKVIKYHRQNAEWRARIMCVSQLHDTATLIVINL